MAEAEAIYRKILAVEPRHAGAMHLLGLVAHQRRDHELAVDLIGRAIGINPREPAYHSNLAEAIRQLGDPEAALAACRRAIAINPDFAEAYTNLGNALREVGRPDEAANAYRDALRRKPTLPRTRSNLGDVLQELGNTDAAIAECSAAIQMNPALAEAHCNLGNALRSQHRLDEAICAYRRGTDLDPNLANAHSNLASTLAETGRLEEALACHDRAAAISPADASLGSSRLFTLQHDGERPAEEVFAEHKAWGRQFAVPLTIARTKLGETNLSPERRLRVGYVSADFRRHPVGQFILPLLAAHDPHVCEIFCYSNLAALDPMKGLLKTHAHEWRNIFGLPDAVVADMVRRDRIDLLIDLSQHTSGNRLLVFARNPAPVQISYLGYPGTTGVPAIDYRLTDHFADPPGLTEELFTESLWCLPRSAWCFSECLPYPPVQPPPSTQGRSVTFGCFNRALKFDAQTIRLWVQILHVTPGSRLLLKDSAFQSADAVGRFTGFFTEHGIARERLELRGRDSDPIQHLDRYNNVDVALDTTNYNGTTTTCEALWMGVPVVALAGRTHASRVGVSLLSNAGLSELVAGNEMEYLRIAAALVADPQRLAALRSSMRDRMRASPLMDAARFARDVEEAYRGMWRRCCHR